MQQDFNSSNSSLPVSPEIVVASSVLGLCFALGVPGNIAVLVLLSRWLKGGSFTVMLMLSLAISDLMTLLLLPVGIYALLNNWSFGLFLCKIFSYMVYWSLYSSVLCVTLLSVQRYVQVLYPQKWANLRAQGRYGLICGLWILSGLLGCYALVQRVVTCGTDGRLHCRAHYKTNSERVATLAWETLALFVLPFPVLVHFYVRLQRGVRQAAFFTNTYRMTKLVTRILLTFFFFWVPHHINNIVLIVAVLRGHERLLKFADENNISGALTFINSCVNPFIYALSARALRQQTSESNNA